MADQFSTDFTPEVYRIAARKRIGTLQLLYDSTEYVLLIYSAGLAVECMLRAYRSLQNQQVNTRHDLNELSRESGFIHRLPKPLVEEYDLDLSVVALRWNNNHRFRSKDSMRRYLKRGHFDRRIKGDFLKENARRVLDSATRLIRLGDVLWKR